VPQGGGTRKSHKNPRRTTKSLRRLEGAEGPSRKTKKQKWGKKKKKKKEKKRQKATGQPPEGAGKNGGTEKKERRGAPRGFSEEKEVANSSPGAPSLVESRRIGTNIKITGNVEKKR